MPKPFYRCLCLSSLAAMFALLAVSCGEPPSQPTPIPSPTPTPGLLRSTGPLAFTSNRDGSDAIYLANADGSAVTRLTTGHAPAWSPDGRQIAFHLNPGIHVVNADGSGFRFVTQGWSPDWSPDGQRLVLSSTNGLAVVDVTGSNRREIYDNRSGGSGPDWSPDGKRIAFSVGTFTDFLDQSFGLWTVNPDGSGATRLPELYDANEPGWSPDSSEIAFNFAGGIGVARADGSGRRVVLASSNFDIGPVVKWTPDGRLIYSRGSHPGPMRIFVNAAGLERQLVPDVTSAAGANYRDDSPSWSRASR